MSAKLYYRAVGNGRPVIILHGGRLDHRHMLDALEPSFSDVLGWRRIYVDLPGCGRSVGFDNVNTQDEVLTEIIHFLSNKIPDGPFAVVGESRGSYLAEGLAHSLPDRVSGLALIVPGGNSKEAKATLPKPVTFVKPKAGADLSDPALALRAKHLVVQTEHILDKIKSTKIPATALHDPLLEERIAGAFDFAFHSEMQSTIFYKPSLVISGRQDSIAGYLDAAQTLSRFSRATYAILDCAGHSLSWERPELFKALFLDWLSRMNLT